MCQLRRSKHSGAFVLGIDHFGKDISLGTKGTIQKESAVDTVIALLGDRDVGGEVKNTRLAVRKQRNGESGQEVPFTPKKAERGTDEDGDAVYDLYIEWGTSGSSAADADATWPPSTRLLKRVLGTVLATVGRNIDPFIDGPTVVACDLEALRAEFFKQYVPRASSVNVQDAKRKAFDRSILTAQNNGLIGSREITGTQWVWFAKARDEGRQSHGRANGLIVETAPISEAMQ